MGWQGLQGGEWQQTDSSKVLVNYCCSFRVLTDRLYHNVHVSKAFKEYNLLSQIQLAAPAGYT